MSGRLPPGPFAVAAILACVVASVPAAALGTVLDPTTPDTTPWLHPATSVRFCYLDDDGNGAYTAMEPVSLHLDGNCATRSASVRLAAFAGRPAGAFIGPSDADGRAAHSTFTETPQLRYDDVDENGRLSAGDVVYLDVVSLSAGRVDAGDVRIIGTESLPGGRHIGPADSDLSRSIGLLGVADRLVAFADVDGNSAFGTSDQILLRPQESTAQGMLPLNAAHLGGVFPASFGTWASLGAPDAPATLRPLASPVLCFASSDDGYGIDDALIIRDGSCSDSATVGDQRVGSMTRRGLRIMPGDAEVGMVTGDVGATFAYRDLDGTVGFGSGDMLYLDTTASPTRIDPGDVRLTPATGLPAADVVQPDSADEGAVAALLGDFDEHIGFVDLDGNAAYDRNDVLYVNADGGGAEDVEVGDVRLGLVGADGFFGSAVVTGSAEAPRRIVDIATSVCFLDGDNDDAYDGGEVVYLNPGSCGSLSAQAIQLHAAEDRVMGDHPPASLVGREIQAPIFRLAFLDIDLSGTWTIGDTAYLHMSANSSPRVQIGDIRLSPFSDEPGGVQVATGAPDVNSGLATVSSNVNGFVHQVDVDGSGGLSNPDLYYLMVSITTAGTTSYGQIRLGGLEAPAPEPDTADPAPTVSPSPSPGSPAPTEASPTASPSASQPGDGDAPRTPAPAAMVLVSIVCAGLAMLRRRQATG